MAISPITGYTDPGSTAERIPMQVLGQQDFLKLLVTQMTSQDPMNPQKDTDFIAQMAQFSALEQSREMQAEIARLRAQQELLQANVLLGQTVEVDDGGSETVTGPVTAVQIQGGTPMLAIGGSLYDLGQVRAITSPLPAETA